MQIERDLMALIASWIQFAKMSFHSHGVKYKMQGCASP